MVLSGSLSSIDGWQNKPLLAGDRVVVTVPGRFPAVEQTQVEYECVEKSCSGYVFDRGGDCHCTLCVSTAIA